MSHTAIAAVLARPDLAMGDRLAALSLASYANREERTLPGNAAAAARAGLGRSRYLEARDRLVARGLFAIEEIGRGRGQATTLIVLFAQSGPWWDGDINAALLEHVLSPADSADLRDCCSERSRPSPTTPVPSTGSRPRTSAAPLAWPTAPTAGRATPSSRRGRLSSSRKAAAAGARTAGASTAALDTPSAKPTAGRRRHAPPPVRCRCSPRFAPSRARRGKESGPERGFRPKGSGS